MKTKEAISNEGGCNCGSVRYEILSDPLFTHICHCTECQHDSGGAFQISTLVLVKDFRLKGNKPDILYISRKSGIEYEVYNCNNCGCTLAGKSVSPATIMVVRPGTLDDTSRIEPQAHIWTKEKQNWVTIPEDIPAFEEEYEHTSVWPKSSLDRIRIT